MTTRFILRAIGILIIIALALTLAIAHGHVTGLQRRRPAPAVLEKIRIAVHSPESDALLYLAKSRGLLEAYGIEATFETCANESEALQAVVDGSAQLATLSDFSFARAAIVTRNLSVLATIARADISQLVARRDHGIVTTSDLKGRRIGVTRKGIGEFLLSRFLAFHDLRLDDVQLLDTPAAEMMTALEDGRIDAAFTWEPHIFEIRSRLGLKAVSWPNTSAEEIYVLLVGQSPWVQEHHVPLGGLLSALVEAEVNLEAEPPVAKASIAAQLGFGRDYIDAVWRRHHYEVTLPQALLLALEDEARWSMRQMPELAGRMPNFLRAIAREPMENVHPESITIIR
jgi:NitT/TauT family transport system substrate-binding protein